jgi:hypothetical protein
MCVYPDQTIGCHGVRRTQKVCRAQPRALARARTPRFYKRTQSLTRRQRLTLLVTGSIRRRGLSAWFALCCANVSASPRGFVVGMRIATWGSVHARKPKSCKSRLPGVPGGQGGVSDTLRVHMHCRGLAEEEEREESIDQEDIFDYGIFYLAAITLLAQFIAVCSA